LAARFVKGCAAQYVGAQMIVQLLEIGYDICGLTRMPTEKLSEMVMLHCKT